MNKKTNISDFGLLGFRTAVSLLMLSHGLPKLLNFQMLAQRFDPIGLGSGLSASLVVFAEFFCSVFLILGLFNRLTLIPLAITMFVAALTHLDDPFSKMELPLLFLASYILLMAIGLGNFRLKFLDIDLKKTFKF